LVVTEVCLDQLETGLQNRWKTALSNHCAASLFEFERILPPVSLGFWMILQIREVVGDLNDHRALS
jgi:hypothetical protein